jgi:hypothetical protein
MLLVAGCTVRDPFDGLRDHEVFVYHMDGVSDVLVDASSRHANATGNFEIGRAHV